MAGLLTPSGVMFASWGFGAAAFLAKPKRPAAGLPFQPFTPAELLLTAVAWGFLACQWRAFSLVPTVGTDSQLYHIFYPATWLRTGSIERITQHGMMTATYPFYGELIYAWQMAPLLHDFFARSFQFYFLGLAWITLAAGALAAGFRRIEALAAGLLLVFACKGELLLLISFTLVLNLLTNLAMLFYIRPAIPGFRLRLWISREVFREIFQFSGFVYLCSVARLLWGRVSPLLISIFCGLQEVGFFQIGSRLPNLMNQLTGPYQENITPISASFYAQGKHRALSRILVNSMRWNSFLATGMSLALICMSGELLEFLFKIEDPLITWGCRIIAMELYIILVFRSIPDKFLVMADYHKFISWIVIAEAGVNVICCLLLLPYFSFIAVTLIALGIKAVSTFALILPLLLRYMKMKYYVLIWKIALLQLAAAIPMCLTLIGLKKVISPGDAIFLYLLAASSAGAAVYLLFSYILTIQKDEKRLVRNKIMALGSEIRQKLCRH